MVEDLNDGALSVLPQKERVPPLHTFYMCAVYLGFNLIVELQQPKERES